MSTNKETVNEVVLQGKIKDVFYKDNVTVLTLAVGIELSSRHNFPQVLCFREAKKQADQFKKDDSVKITGNIQSSRRNPNIKNQVLVSILAETVESAKSRMEEAFNVQGAFVKPQNSFCVAGKVSDVELHASNVCNITVKTYKNGHVSFVRLVRYMKSPQDSALTIAPDDYVYALGQVQTTKKEENGKFYYYQNYVANEIKIKK